MFLLARCKALLLTSIPSKLASTTFDRIIGITPYPHPTSNTSPVISKRGMFSNKLLVPKSNPLLENTPLSVLNKN